jgi:pilus assembly protein CpaF
VVAIRRSRAVPLRLEQLKAAHSLTGDMADFLGAAVHQGLNILVSGGASTGKTTFLNILSHFIPTHERVVTIEETAELRFGHPHVISLETRLPNVEGRGEVDLRTLLRNSLRMRADRIIVGEVRGPEVFDMLQAMNLGHPGSLTTVHANTAEDALRRLEHLVLMGGFDLPNRAIREMVGAAIDLVVHMVRLPNGDRRVASISEVVANEQSINARDIFRYVRNPDQLEAAGEEHALTGYRPSFAARLRPFLPAIDTWFPEDSPSSRPPPISPETNPLEAAE